MNLQIEERESEILLDTIQHRLYTDKTLDSNEILREELEDLLRKIEEYEYL
jgi:hypothetical protein